MELIGDMFVNHPLMFMTYVAGASILIRELVYLFERIQHRRLPQLPPAKKIGVISASRKLHREAEGQHRIKKFVVRRVKQAAVNGKYQTKLYVHKNDKEWLNEWLGNEGYSVNFSDAPDNPDFKDRLNLTIKWP